MIASNKAPGRTSGRLDMSVRYDISIPVIIAVQRLLLVFLCLPAAAHDVPRDLTVHVWAKPSGRRLEAIVRLPLGAIRDIEFPETSRGYLDIERLTSALPAAAQVWVGRSLLFYADARALPEPRVAAVRVSLPSDRAFASFDDALRQITGGPLPSGANVVWNHAALDVLLEYDTDSDAARFSVWPRFGGLAARVVTVFRWAAPDGSVRAYEFTGDPEIVPIEPGWTDSAVRFAALGFRHILDGSDHLLFLLCLVIPIRRLRPLIVVITAFTAAHSVTLAAAAADLAPAALWFSPLIEVLIAGSIVWMAIENIVGGGALRRRWMVAFGFGLVHGFGFSFGLKENLQFAGGHLFAALASFNIGVELGQMTAVLVMTAVLWFVFRYVVVESERVGVIVLSALVAHTGVHWTIERAAQLRLYRFEWPRFSSAGMALAAESLLWLAIVAAVAYFVRTLAGTKLQVGRRSN
jgi:hypothetical protein